MINVQSTEIVRTNKYRLYPTATQKAMLHEMFSLFRFSYNSVLGKIKDSQFGTYEIKTGKNAGKVTQRIPSQTEIVGYSTRLKDEHAFVNRLPNDYIQASLSNLYSSVKGFYRGGGYPKFKSRKTDKQSINMYAGSRVKIQDNFIQLSRSRNSAYSKSDHCIRFKKHKTNYPIGKITGYSIEKDNLDNYYITITHKIDVCNTRVKTGKSTGIDLGIKELVSCSSGLVIHNHNLTKLNARKLKLEQRKLSKKRKGSQNRKKQRIKVAKVHKRIGNARKDYNHKVSKTLINLYDVIVLESLQVKNMVQNRKLSKAISNVAWSQLLNFIQYKADENQTSVYKIDRWYPSSKTCSKCGSIKETLLLSERIYHCEECGLELDRDINASINILNEGLRLNKAG